MQLSYWTKEPVDGSFGSRKRSTCALLMVYDHVFPYATSGDSQCILTPLSSVRKSISFFSSMSNTSFISFGVDFTDDH